MDVRSDTEGLERLFVTAPEFDAKFEVYGKCPVQGFGTVLNRELYFRARHNHWSFDVADNTGKLPSDGAMHSDGFYREGEYADAGWMTNEEAIRIIVRCLEEFTGAKAMPGQWPSGPIRLP